MSEDKSDDPPRTFRGFTGVSEKPTSAGSGGQSSSRPGVAWYYTTGARFADIDRQGEISPTTGGIGRGGRPVAWFSLNTTFEPTARTMFENADGSVRMLSMGETAKHGRGLFRIGVRPELLKSLDEWIADSRVPGDTADILKAIGQAHGADPNEWMVSFVAVQRADWIAVEVRYRGEWRSITED